MIKDDRKRRHKRRRDQDAMVDAFARTVLDPDREPGPPQELDNVVPAGPVSEQQLSFIPPPPILQQPAMLEQQSILFGQPLH